MKKTISVILSCIFIFAMAMPAFATETIEEDIMPVTEITEVTETEEFNEETTLTETPVEVAEINNKMLEAEVVEIEETEASNINKWGENTPVARVYLCATLNSLTGHIWLYFINLTECELPLGYVTLRPYEEMSVGSLRNTRKDGGGTYYNGEAFMADDLSSVSKHTTSIYMDINYDQLITIGNKIKSKNSYVLLGNNCGDFACSCWNAIAPLGKRVVNILVPLFTIFGIIMAGSKNGQIEMVRPDISRVFKQINNGVKQVVPESFKFSCVNW